MAKVIAFTTTYRNYEEADMWAQYAELQKDPHPEYVVKDGLVSGSLADNIFCGCVILLAIAVISYIALRSV